MDTALIKKHTPTLEAIMETDQQAIKDFRAAKITAFDLMEINRRNVVIVKNIITEIGFPKINLTSQKNLNHGRFFIKRNIHQFKRQEKEKNILKLALVENL